MAIRKLTMEFIIALTEYRLICEPPKHTYYQHELYLYSTKDFTECTPEGAFVAFPVMLDDVELSSCRQFPDHKH